MPIVGLYPLLERQEARDWTLKAIEVARRARVEVALPPEAARVLGFPEYERPISGWQGVDLALTLGGDGTLLAAATQLAPLGVPLLGLNLGRVGFLTELEVKEFQVGLEAALGGDLVVDERMMVEGRLDREGETVGHFLALNDIVLAKGPFARLLRLQAYVGESPLGRYSADGLILATPTGSTAYALSAGGPVLAPEVEAILVTPICPHSLDSRSVVVPPEATVTVELKAAGDRTETFLTADGQLGAEVQPGDRLTVWKSSIRTKLLRHPGYDFLQVLRRKLSEGTL